MRRSFPCLILLAASAGCGPAHDHDAHEAPHAEEPGHDEHAGHGHDETDHPLSVLEAQMQADQELRDRLEPYRQYDSVWLVAFDLARRADYRDENSPGALGRPGAVHTQDGYCYVQYMGRNASQWPATYPPAARWTIYIWPEERDDEHSMTACIRSDGQDVYTSSDQYEGKRARPLRYAAYASNADGTIAPDLAADGLGTDGSEWKTRDQLRAERDAIEKR